MHAASELPSVLSLFGATPFETAAPKHSDTDWYGGTYMLWTIFVILLILWLIGVVTSYTLGGFIHVLLVLAVIALIFQLLSGRRVA